MTESPTTVPEPTADAAPARAPRKSGGALGGKVLAELQEIAAGLGIDNTAKMRKGELIDAIKAARGETPRTEPAAGQAPAVAEQAPQGEKPAEKQPDQSRDQASAESREQSEPSGGRRRNANHGDGGQGQDKQDQPKNNQKNDQGGQNKGGQNKNDQNKNDQNKQNKQDQGKNGQGGQNKNAQDKNNQDKNDRQDRQDRQDDADDRQNGDEEGTGRRRNRRGRGRTGRGTDGEPTYAEDDVLVPAAGILDILDNYAFVRTTGYLPSENDVYVSLSMVRKLGLRRGDAVVGQVRQPREGERKEKFNPMVRVDSVNGQPTDEARTRVEFSELTPLFPTERLHLETDAATLTTRMFDLVAPLGKGQRGLVVSPPKAGKTVVLQAVADAVMTNNPECHLMVVLVDERPEEVTELQRSVKGEVIASTFDRPATDHTTIAELAIERAKRLVELGHDVVVLLDSITRLGRAYNLSAPASGRILAGGVDSSALYPPKKFFGAARNIEDGGSLTILATALVETGSTVDEVIFEEIKGTANLELHLRSDLAEKRIFPAIDVAASSTRREEQLLGEDELATLWKLRRVVSDLDPQKAQELVVERLKKSSDNADFLAQAARTLPNG
ncbi:transcription termination factor Rho [Aeromicrobium sp. Root495]|uniref:transcription termination factor Rho n=1 Tax=Aeromicrobium sp. Root495 TaxID=1736550 RepID=UPI000A5D148C|nr:transcription termination factor Rho [Aeromicrobium sp. Root495]